MHTSREMVEEAVSKIRDAVEGRNGRRRSRRPRSMIRFLLPPESGLDAPVPDELAQAILDETWDLMESPVLEDAQRDCLDITFDLMRDEGWGTIFVDSNSPQHASSAWTTKPLASVITQLKRASNSFYKSARDSQVGSSTCCQRVRECHGAASFRVGACRCLFQLKSKRDAGSFGIVS